MSSVLEALKQMEHDEENGAVATAANAYAPVRRRNRPWVLPLVVIVAAVAGGAGGFFLARPPEPAALSVAQPAKDTPVFRVVAPETPAEISPERHNLASPEEAPPWVVENAVAEKALAFKAPKTKKLIGEEAPSQPNPESRTQPQVTAAAPVENVPPELVETSLNLPAADASSFKLQGVRWSETPTRRIAVINGEILREGGMVGGAKILTINADGVVLHVEGNRQFLAFSGR